MLLSMRKYIALAKKSDNRDAAKKAKRIALWIYCVLKVLFLRISALQWDVLLLIDLKPLSYSESDGLAQMLNPASNLACSIPLISKD